MKRIVITGGIGSGKSVVCNYLEKLGFDVIYADKVARSMTESGGAAIDDIRREFGEDFINPDGSLNRSKMRDCVYNDKHSLALLEKYTTNKVPGLINSKLLNIEKTKNPKAAFIEIPLVFEKNSQDDFDMVWLVISDREDRINRIMERDSISREKAISIMETQMSDEDKIKLSDEVVKNFENIQKIYRQIDNLIVKYQLL